MSNKDPNELISSSHESRPNDDVLGILGAVALTALIIGAVGSLIYMYRQGQDTPLFLMVLFTIRASMRWQIVTRWTLYGVTLIVALSSLAIYGEWVHVRPPGSANAFLFVAVPPISFLFAAIVVPIAAVISGRLSREDRN